MMSNMNTKVWFVTGAGKGIGKAIVNGDCVIATARNPEEISVPSEYKNRIMTEQLDVSCPDETIYSDVVQKGLERFGQIDFLVNNAGFGGITNFEETSEKMIRDMFEVNVFGLMRVTRAILPIMRRQRNGHIFNIASAAG